MKLQHHLYLLVILVFILLLTACGRGAVGQTADIPFPDESLEAREQPSDTSAPLGDPIIPDSNESSENGGSDQEGSSDNGDAPQLPNENEADAIDELIDAVNNYVNDNPASDNGNDDPDPADGPVFEEEERLLLNLYGTWYNAEDEIYSLIIEEDLIKIVTGFEIDYTAWFDIMEINVAENYILIEMHTIDDGFEKYEPERVTDKLEYNGNLLYYHNHGQPDEVSSVWTR